MEINTAARRQTRNTRINILVSDIKYSSKCSDFQLPHDLCCDSCKSIIESESGQLKKSSHSPKRFRDYSKRRQCGQPWASVNGESCKTVATNRKFVRVRNYMKIDCDVLIKYCYIYDKSTKRTKPQEKTITSKYNTEGNPEPSHVHPEVSVDEAWLELQPSQTMDPVPPTATTTQEPNSTPPLVLRSDLPPIPNHCCNKCKNTIIKYLNNLSGWGPTDPPSGQQAIPTRPNRINFKDALYVTVSKRKYNQLERDAKVGESIRKYSTGDKKYCTSTDLGRRLYAMAVVHAPKLGLATLAKIISLASAGTLANLGVSPTYLPSLASLTPSPATLNKLVIELGVDVVLLISNDIKQKKLSLICDKGENKGPAASFVKLLCWYNKINKRVEVICFGIESAGNTSKDAAQAVSHSLKLFEYSQIGTRLSFHSSTTDAGGGGTNESLVRELERVERALLDVNYDWVNCALHALNLMLQCPIEEVLGAGGLKKRTFMQMLHTSYTLKSLYPIKTWREMWRLATTTTWKDMKCPVLSRWEHVGEAAQHVVKYKEQWMLIAKYIIDMHNVGTNKNDIASYLYSYLKEDMLYAQLLFVNGYITGFFDKHLQWQKQICPKSNRAGFRAIDMGVNLYIMHRDLEDLKANWRLKDYMVPFVQIYPTTALYKIDDMVSDFFKIVQHRMKKHLTQWREHGCQPLYYAP